jgi:thiol-disulfide isomerase/thioredoxin
MKNLARFLLLISLLLVNNYSAPATSVLEDRWLNGSAGYARALELQRELNVPLVIYFYADWCPYCRSLDGQYLPTAPVQDYLRGVVKVRINPEHGRPERELANRYGVTGYPTFLVMRSAAARPLNIQPFRKDGANLTPAEFANACRQVAPVSRTVGAVNRFSNQTTKAQIVEVGPAAAAAGPEFINDPEPPTLDQVLAKYVEAIGGRAAQMRLNTRVATGRVDLVGISNGGRLESYATAPNKSLMVMQLDSVGTMRKGFDGRSGWEQSDQLGVRMSTGVSLESLARDADFYHDLKLKELFLRTKLLGRVKYGFRQVYLVDAKPRVGPSERLYFDTESGLLIQRDVTRQTSRGPVRAEIYLSDWRSVDGVKIPFKMTQKMPNQTFVFTLDSVKHNVPVDAAMFQKPPR